MRDAVDNGGAGIRRAARVGCIRRRWTWGKIVKMKPKQLGDTGALSRAVSYQRGPAGELQVRAGLSSSAVLHWPTNAGAVKAGEIV